MTGIRIFLIAGLILYFLLVRPFMLQKSVYLEKDFFYIIALTIFIPPVHKKDNYFRGGAGCAILNI